MMEYLYSRILVTVAAVAITGLVVAASINSSYGTLRALAEDIAREFAELVSLASKIGCEYFTADFIIADLPFSLTAELRLQRQSISVSIGEHRAFAVFENCVSLVEGNKTVDELEFLSSTHGICVKSERDIFNKDNRVTLVLIDLPH